MRKFILISLLLCFCVSVQAAVRKNVLDGESITIQLSNKDPNVISVKYDRIERFSVVKGAVVSSLDSKHGVLTVKPSSSTDSEPFSMIIFTETGKRFTLMVLPMAIPSQDIILMQDSLTFDKPNIFEYQSPYTEVVSELIRHMAKNSLPEDYKRIFINEKPVSFMSGELKHISTYQGNHLSGEILEYTHCGLNAYKLIESDFYARDIMAVALSQNFANSGEVVTVFRVKKNG